MKQWMEKHELAFALIGIGVYVVGTSLADNLSETMGMPKLLTAVFHGILTAILLGMIVRAGKCSRYGLRGTPYPAKQFLYYLPLVVIGSCNLWFGVGMRLNLMGTVCYVVSMLCVGFLEEVIFRGLLFCAMKKDSIRSAMVVSSVTFGIGHIVNLFNGSGVDLLSNLCQVGYAIAFGFLFVILFYRGRSLLPCILTHSVINSLSVFSKEYPTPVLEIVTALILAAVALGYSLILLKTLPPVSEETEQNA